jgi:hypothetical protein
MALPLSECTTGGGVHAALPE